MELYSESVLLKSRVYDGLYETQTIGNNTAQYCYIEGGNGITAVMINKNLTNTMYYLLRDQQGSITGLVDDQRTLIEEYSYDAWGRRRNPSNWTYDNTPVPQFMFRGYTMHEMLDEFALINMNGRCYDPVVGRFLSPDIIIQDGNNTQCYNKYSYCVNNPLKYTDPSGWKVDQNWYNNHIAISNWWDLDRILYKLQHQWRNVAGDALLNSFIELRGCNNIESAMIGSGRGEMTFFLTTSATDELIYMAALKQAYSTPIDISNFTSQQFSEAFLGVCAYEQFFGDGSFTMGQYFTGNKENYFFSGKVTMNRGGYEYTSYVLAKFKMSDKIDLKEMQYDIQKDQAVSLEAMTYIKGSGELDHQDPNIIGFSQSFSIDFNNLVKYQSFNYYGGTARDYYAHKTYIVSEDGYKLTNGLSYRFDINNIAKARYFYNNYGSHFGYNWWYRY